jgi:hypothetical protein
VPATLEEIPLLDYKMQRLGNNTVRSESFILWTSSMVACLNNNKNTKTLLFGDTIGPSPQTANAVTTYLAGSDR